MDACARLDEREGWKTLKVQGEGFERRLESISILERVRGWSYRDPRIPQTGVSSTLGLKERR